MTALSFITVIFLLQLSLSHAFAPRKIKHVNDRIINKVSTVRLNSFVDISSALIAVGDYAAEIEKGVGEEIYAPIFKSGLVLFGSGLISAFMAAAIIAKSDSWEELGLEFERGKVAQLIELDVNPNNATPTNVGESVVSAIETPAPKQVTKEERKLAESVKANADGVYDLDL